MRMGVSDSGGVKLNRVLTSAIAALLGRGIERGDLPGGAWCVQREGVTVSRGASGHSVIVPRTITASSDTIYDLASLTKPLVTTTLVLLAVADGRIGLDDPVAGFVEEVAAHKQLAGTTWADLLAHRAGFEAWYPLYVEGRDRSSYLATLLSRPLAYPPRSTAIYSDLSFVLLFVALERLFGDTFESIANERLIDRLGLQNCMFHPSESLRDRVAATEVGNETEREMVQSRGLSFDGWRDEPIWGEVNDGNAWYLGGVAGNAGLFGDAVGVARLASIYLDGGGILPEPIREAATRCHAEGENERRGLGWQLPTGELHPAARLSESTFGHTGFTGTSVWLDPAASLVVVLLTNRIHPRARRSGIRQIRRGVNDLVAETYL